MITSLVEMRDQNTLYSQLLSIAYLLFKRLLITLSEELTNHASESVAFGTEGSFYNDMGIETVILGPGDIDVAHQPNEYLQIDRIEPMINIDPVNISV